MTKPKIGNMQDALAYNEAIGGSRMIVYDGVNVRAPVRDIRQAITSLSNGDRQHIVMLVRRAIEKTLPAVRQGTASQYVAMKCARDPIAKFCNDLCVRQAGPECVNVTMEMRESARSKEMREPKLVWREATDREKYEYAMSKQSKTRPLG